MILLILGCHVNTLQPIFKAATPEQIAKRPKPKGAFHNEYNGYIYVVIGIAGVQGPTGTTGVAGIDLPRITALLPSLVMDNVQIVEPMAGHVYYFNVVKNRTLSFRNKLDYWWRKKILKKKEWNE